MKVICNLPYFISAPAARDLGWKSNSSSSLLTSGGRLAAIQLILVAFVQHLGRTVFKTLEVWRIFHNKKFKKEYESSATLHTKMFNYKMRKQFSVNLTFSVVIKMQRILCLSPSNVSFVSVCWRITCRERETEVWTRENCCCKSMTGLLIRM